MSEWREKACQYVHAITGPTFDMIELMATFGRDAYLAGLRAARDKTNEMGELPSLNARTVWGVAKEIEKLIAKEQTDE